MKESTYSKTKRLKELPQNLSCYLHIGFVEHAYRILTRKKIIFRGFICVKKKKFFRISKSERRW